MNEDQDTIGPWAVETFPGGDPTTPADALRLLEEAYELCLNDGASTVECLDRLRAVMLRKGLNPTRKQADPVGSIGEAADCSILLAIWAHRRGVHLPSEVDAKMAINRHRVWIPNGNGTGQHVKQAV